MGIASKPSGIAEGEAWLYDYCTVKLTRKDGQ